MTSTTMGDGSRLWPANQAQGVSCDNRGAYIGKVALLQRQTGSDGRDAWTVRSAPELNAALSDHYGFPIDMTRKLDGLSEVADSLNRGDMFHAQLGTLDLKLPDPPPPGGLTFGRHVANLAMQLHDSGMLDRGTAAESSRDAATNFSSLPGTDAGVATDRGNMNSTTPSAGPQYRSPTTMAQAIPFDLFDLPWARPFGLPIPRTLPEPSEVAPVPFEFPGYRATRKPVGNPFPDDAECCKEWAEAKKACIDLWEDRELGEGSNFGTRYEDCLMAMVTERCGGNEVKDAPQKVRPYRA